MTVLFCGHTARAANDADARLRAIYTAEWKWRDEQIAGNEDAQKPIRDHLPKVDPASQAMRLQHVAGRAREAQLQSRARNFRPPSN